MLTANISAPRMLFENATNPGERDYEDLAAVARKCLRASAHRALRYLTCEYGQGILILRGRVSSYYDKQLAQESVRHLPGIKGLLNGIEVVVPQHSLRGQSPAGEMSRTSDLSRTN